jgi:hypothetical protein
MAPVMAQLAFLLAGATSRAARHGYTKAEKA